MTEGALQPAHEHGRANSGAVLAVCAPVMGIPLGVKGMAERVGWHSGIIAA